MDLDARWKREEFAKRPKAGRLRRRNRTSVQRAESEERFRLMADSAPVMIWMSGPDKLCTYFNKTWLDFTGRPIERELGAGWSEGVHPDDLERCLDTYVRAFDARQGFRMEYRLRRFDGEHRWILDAGAPRFESDGAFAGYIGSAIDIHDRKRAEMDAHQLRQELAHVGRVATLGELAGSLAHELKQPLTAILANAQAAVRLLPSSSELNEVREILHDIAEDDERAVEVIGRLRSLLKKEELACKPLELNDLVQRVVQLVSHETTVRRAVLALDLDPALPPVSGDRVQLQQVLLNLIMNGLDAVSAVAPEDRKLLIRTRRQGAHTIEVAVCDSGTGIDSNRLAQIFEPFVTTKPHGLGLGLSISRSIIEAHGGQLTAANNPDRGATFRFILPVEEDHD
jgi:PAS domain S-box-containing protein